MAEFQRKCWLDITGIERVLREILTKKVHLKVEQKNNDTRKLMSRGNSTLKKTSDLLHVSNVNIAFFSITFIFREEVM